MPGPLEGIRVIEMGVWVAGPSCAGMLADWGADVIKVEPPDGDPFRGLFAGLLDVPMNPPFELDNRGKRSVALDLDTDQGRELMLQLIDGADVFVSNMRPRALAKFGLSYEECSARYPRLVYCQVAGYGPETEDANRAAYDVGAFWSRAGVTASLVPPGVDPPQQRGGMGDHMTGANAAGAVSAALYNREKTGKGQRVAVSLFRIGAYMMGWDWNTALRFGQLAPPYDRYHAVNPIINSFHDRDGKWFYLLLLQADRHWPDLLRALEAPDLATDPRFQDIPGRMAHSVELVTALDALFHQKPLAEWGAIFDRENVWWAPINTVMEAVADPMATDSGALIQMESPEGPVTQVATPADFYGTPVRPTRWAPELGQHTEEVLLELGYDWDRIIAFKEAGAIP